MDIWNQYLHEKKHKKKMEHIKNNNNILKNMINPTTTLEHMFWKLQRQKKIIYHKLLETYHEKKYKCLKYFFSYNYIYGSNNKRCRRFTHSIIRF